MLPVKRIFDVALSTVGLVVFSPVLTLAALWVRIEAGAPVIFKQERVGMKGRSFDIYKFRTMRPVDGLAITSGGDPRITASGRWLRAFKVDELPQLWNVVRGEMSLVGPRPEVPRYVDEWPPGARDVVLSVRPGITDPASIRFRNEGELLASSSDPERDYLEKIMPEKVGMYVEYVERQTLAYDVRLILQTVRSIFVGS
jgi:lipopolysaccharide/colanic/teichoic acid biosynthesis glycosyltransferase